MMKKTRNYIRIVALLLAVVTVFTVPVSADSDRWLNVLDYATVDGTGSNYIHINTSKTVTFDIGFKTLTRYVDILINSSSGDIISASCNGSALTVLPLDSNIFRLYGSTSNNHTGVFELTLNSDSSCHAYVISFLAHGYATSVFPDSLSASLVFGAYSQSGNFTGSQLNLIIDPFSGNSSSPLLPFLFTIRSSNWRKYDFMDVCFSVQASTISSISATLGDIYIPFELTFLDHNLSYGFCYSSSGYSDLTNLGSDDYTYQFDFNNTCEYEWSEILVHLDLSQVNRNISDDLVITVRGTADYSDGVRASIFGCNGYVQDHMMDPTNFWLQGILDQAKKEYEQSLITFDLLVDFFESVESNFDALKVSFEESIDGLQASVDDWYAFYVKSTSGLQATLEALRVALDTWLTDVTDYQQASIAVQESIKTEMIAGFDDISSDIYSMRVSLGNKITDLQTALDGWFQFTNDKIQYNFDELFTLLNEKFKAVTDRLDKLIGGTTEGDELSQGAADLEEQVGDIHDFEQSQQAVLDNNFDAIQGAVTFTGFTAALAFVQRYINLSWAGIQGFSVIYTLPIFIGLFFFVCGRIPGATRWRSRPPKDGGSA